MKKQKIRVNDVFPNWLLGGGIFTTLQQFDVPWKDESMSKQLDIDYHGNHSGQKVVSPLVKSITQSELSDNDKLLLSETIMALYGVNWSKQWATLNFDYNPIENYSMTEQMSNDITTTQYEKNTTRTDDLTHTETGTETETPNLKDTQTKTGTDSVATSDSSTRTDDLTHAKTGSDNLETTGSDTRTDNLTTTKTGTDTLTNNLTDTSSPEYTTSTNSGIYGFNSTSSVPVTTSSQTESGSGTVQHTGTEEREYNISDKETGTQKYDKSGSSETTYNTTDTDTGTQKTESSGSNETTYDTTIENTHTGIDTKNYNHSLEDTGTQKVSDSGTDTHTRNYNLTRSGNIGVTTSQQMIESERQLWIWNFFHDVVFPDIDRVLTINIY